jgi:type II secretory pathway pseudopilin PulG
VVELLVVIGIIALLAGILLVALQGASRSAQRADTLATMQAFKSACETYRQEHGEYPGVIPEAILADFLPARLTATENALLALLGGYMLLRPTDDGTPTEDAYDAFNGVEVFDNAKGWKMKVNRDKIGEGPIIGGKQYPPYLSLKENQLRAVPHRDPAAFGAPLPDDGLPDLLDRWGQPIMYFRRISPNGPLVGMPEGSGGAAVRPQFTRQTNFMYFGTDVPPGLGDLGKSQTENNSGTILLLSTGAAPDANQNDNWALAQIIRARAMGSSEITLLNIDQLTARGDLFLVSAGPDGIYFSVADGPGTLGTPVTDITSAGQGGPSVVDEYDDMIVAGGG